MKKTVTANIAGSVFHIEEDAYEQLQRYLAGIRANFKGSPGAADIMADIEARIAELFTERLVGRNVVTIADIQHVENVMGKPEDFAGESDGTAPGATGTSSDAGAGRAERRFMRDPDDKWIGGVIGGLAAYIGQEAIWFRIAFIVAIWLGWGTPILVYLLLWVLVPKASTAAERLQMRGEPVTVDNIKRVVEEGGERFKQGAERMANEAKDLGKEWGPRSQQWGQEVGGTARRVGGNAANVIGKVIGAGIVVVAFSLLLGLITGLIGGSVSLWSATWSSEDLGLLDLGGLVFNSKAHAMWFGIGLFLLLVVPIISLFLLGFRMLLNTRTPKWLGWSLAGLWICALIPTILAGIDLGNDFRRRNTARTEAAIEQPASNTMYLDVLAPTDSASDWSVRYDDGEIDIDLDGLHVEKGMVSGGWGGCDVEQSNDSLFHLLIVREARARNAKAALSRAERIGFTYKQEGDALLLSPVLRFAVEDKLRAQTIRFVLQVPDGKSVFFRVGSKEMLDDIGNTTNTYDDDMVGKCWTMTPSGLQLGTPSTIVPPSDTTSTTPERVVERSESSRTSLTNEVAVEEAERIELPNVFRLLSSSVHI
jgi:phage shock protein PspC (stress-responsive transcriptional regulator)